MESKQNIERVKDFYCCSYSLST